MAQKKALTQPLEVKRAWIEPNHSQCTIARQCELIGLARSSYYYLPAATESEENLGLMRQIDALYLQRPEYGYPRMTRGLKELGWIVNKKRVARLMRVMGLQAIMPGPHTSRRHAAHPVYPYLLRGLSITAPDQVWCADITYVPMQRGFLYLVVVMDWYSRYVLAWELSNSLDSDFCVRALERALAHGTPGIFNTDQGAQFTSTDFTKRLTDAGIRISMNGRGRATDNIFVERLWRTVKYENIYPRDYADGTAVRFGLDVYFRYYNAERWHRSLDNRTPAAIYCAKAA